MCGWKKGIEEVMEIEMNAGEMRGFEASAKKTRGMIKGKKWLK